LGEAKYNLAYIQSEHDVFVNTVIIFSLILTQPAFNIFFFDLIY